MNEQVGKTGPNPIVPYWHLTVDADGISSQTRCALTGYERKSVGPADLQWNNKMARCDATVVLSEISRI